MLLEWERDSGFRGLHGHTISSFRCVVFCAGPMFKKEFRGTESAVFLLPIKFQTLFALVYMWPCKEIDGDQCPDGEGEYQLQSYESMVRKQPLLFVMI